MIHKDLFEDIVGKCIGEYPVVYTKGISNSKILSCANNKYEIADARSAGYFATGMSAETKKTVVLVCNGNIESRSIMSAATEAYYRRLPVLFVTISKAHGVDYKKEIKDTFARSFYVDSNMKEDKLVNAFREAGALCDNGIAPIHIVVNSYATSDDSSNTGSLNANYARILDNLKDVLTEEDYCLVSKFISIKPKLKCKVYSPSEYNFEEGAIATVLGASLSGNRKRYICLITENEIIHDLNTLGNICMNDKVIVITVCRHYRNFIKDYALNLGFDVLDTLNLQGCQRKTLILIEG